MLISIGEARIFGTSGQFLSYWDVFLFLLIWFIVNNLGYIFDLNSFYFLKKKVESIQSCLQQLFLGNLLHLFSYFSKSV